MTVLFCNPARSQSQVYIFETLKCVKASYSNINEFLARRNEAGGRVHWGSSHNSLPLIIKKGWMKIEYCHEPAVFARTVHVVERDWRKGYFFCSFQCI